MPTERQLNIILESELEFKPYDNLPPMTQSSEPTIEQMDKAIAEFMELETDNEPHLAHRRTVYLVNGYWWPLRKLKYHTSWDWLIPVIKKIKGMHMDILQQAFVLDYMHAAGIMNSGLISLDIDKAHKGVYEFLIWYNQQKQKDGEEAAKQT